jgi:nicotinamidase-related amidase
MKTAERHRLRILSGSCALLACGLGLGFLARGETPRKEEPAAKTRSVDPQTATGQRTYRNHLTPLTDPAPLLADYPEFVQPVIEKTRYEAPILVDEPGADLDVRAWRFSYNARGIIELPNHLRADHTAAIMVHPWGIDDGQGWRTPEPAGVADFCTPAKNHLAGRHTREVVDPLLQRLRGRVSLVLFSLRGHQYPAQAKIYRSVRHTPSEAERTEGQHALAATLNGFRYRGEPVPAEFNVSDEHPVRDYFQQFPGLDAGARFNNAGFWDLPIPVTKDVTVFPEDVVYYDEEGYPALRDFLKQRGVRHVLLTGYATDMCFCRTTAGYENLSKDFDVFLVGDATLATYPANETPRYATNAHISFASINQLITQCSWIRFRSDAKAK